MSGSSDAWRASQPWSGLVVGVLAGGIAHQFGAEGMFDDCQRIGYGAVQIVGIFCILAALIGGWLSLGILRGEGESHARRVIAAISVGFAPLAAFSILLPLIASITLPPCFQ